MYFDGKIVLVIVLNVGVFGVQYLCYFRYKCFCKVPNALCSNVLTFKCFVHSLQCVHIQEASSLISYVHIQMKEHLNKAFILLLNTNTFQFSKKDETGDCGKTEVVSEKLLKTKKVRMDLTLFLACGLTRWSNKISKVYCSFYWRKLASFSPRGLTTVWFGLLLSEHFQSYVSLICMYKMQSTKHRLNSL